MFLPAVIFFMIALAAMIADTPKFISLGFPVSSVILVPATFISVAPTFLLVWALISFRVGQTTFVAFGTIFVDICQGCSMPVVLNFLVGAFFVSLKLPLFVHRHRHFSQCGFSFLNVLRGRARDRHYLGIVPFSGTKYAGHFLLFSNRNSEFDLNGRVFGQ